METAPALHVVEHLPLDLRVEVDAFLDTLRKEQTRFLDAIGQARSLLGGQSGQLAHVTAIQGRLTRQFFDAQRSIVARRAEVDAEVERIVRDADREAMELVATARAQAEAKLAAGGVAGLPVPFPPPVTPSIRQGFEGNVRSTRQEIAALGVASMRTMAEADSLARIIDEAFEPDEPDGAAAARQLATVLDEWWHAEHQEGQAVIDDAHARAAVRRHVAGVEAHEIIESVHLSENTLEPLTSSTTLQLGESVLPPDMRRALEQGGDDGLDALLASLARSLQPTISPFEPPQGTAADDLVILPQSAAPRSSTATSPEDAFRRFWGKGPDQPPHSATSRLSVRGVATHVVLPIAAVTSGLAALMAWMG
jgi:cell division septum initiation protein DivIVA